MSPMPGSPTTAPPDPAAAPSTRDAADPHRGRLRWLAIVGVALVLMLVVRGLLVQSFYVPSASMEPTLAPGDRILVSKVAVGSSLHRGDVVVFDGTHSFADQSDQAPTPTGALSKVVGAMASLLSVQLHETDYVKRVIGLPGDHVVCCDAQGRLSVNGTAVREAYLYPGDKPSDLTFDVVVPAGRVWVMGDHRSDSADSRAHLGDPGGGMVRVDDLIGRVAFVYWPVSRAQVLRTPPALTRIAGAGAR